MRNLLLATSLLLAACVPETEAKVEPLSDPDARAAFVEANVLAIFYPELGHALIHDQSFPVLGREEEAVDGLSSILIDALWEPETAEDFLRLNGQAWLAYAARAEKDEEPAYWDSHALDIQRYYNHVCLIFGADPDRRAELAKEMNLPEDRMEGCADEYELAARSWDAMLQSMQKGPNNPDRGRLVPHRAPPPAGKANIVALLNREVDDFNESYALNKDISIALESCGEENAFYDLDLRRVIICAEYVDGLSKLYDEVP